MAEDARADPSADDRVDQTADGPAGPPEDRPGEPLGVAVMTVSSTRTLDSDDAGAEVVSGLEAAGNEVVTRELIEKSFDNVQAMVSRLVDRDDVDLVVTIGGTGLEPADVTIDAVDSLLEKNLPAFGQLFTHLSYESIGTRAVAGRTTAGTVDTVPVFSLPGDPDATRLAVEEIIRPEAPNLVATANGTDEGDETGEIDEIDQRSGPIETDDGDGPDG